MLSGLKRKLALMRTYGDRLQAAMTWAGCDRKKLADAVGLSVQAVGQCIAGTTKFLATPHHEKAVKLLGVNSMWLATGEEEMLKSEKGAIWLFSKELFNAAASLDKHGRERLEGVLQAMLLPAQQASDRSVATPEAPTAELPAPQPTQGLRLAASDMLPLTPTKTNRLDEKIIKKTSKKLNRKA